MKNRSLGNSYWGTPSLSPNPKLPSDFVKFCNDLRCPLCGSQLDGGIYSTEARLYCVETNSEYGSTWVYGEVEPHYEQIIHYAFEYEYEIISRRTGIDHHTSITRYFRGVDPEYRSTGKGVMLELDAQIPTCFRQRLSERDFLDKLSLYMTFS